MQPEYERIVTIPFHYGNAFQLTRIAADSVHVANEALVEIYCHLYTNSTGNITLLLYPDYWNLTSIPVDVGQTINVTVTNGNLNLDSDVAAKLQIDIHRTSVDDEVQGLLVLKVITSGWQKASWAIFSIFAVVPLLLLRIHRRRRSNASSRQIVRN